MEMIPRERVLCSLNLGVPDRVSYCEATIDPVVAAKLLDLETPTEAAEAGYFKRSVDVEIALSRLLHRDNIICRIRPPIFAEKLKAKDGMIVYGKGLIQNEEDLELLKLPDPCEDNLYIEAEEFVRNKGDFALGLSTKLGIAPTYLSMGYENFCYALYDKPKLVEKILDIYCEWAAVVVERICQLGFDFIWSADDLAWKTGPLFSPKFFHDIAVPRIRKIAEKVTIPWVHHSDGNILPLLDDIIDLGINGIHPIEAMAMDINSIKKNYGNKICLLGNIDVETLTVGTPEQVKEEVKKRIKEIGPEGGYIVTSGNSVASYCKPENVLAMVEAVQEYGKYPISIK